MLRQKHEYHLWIYPVKNFSVQGFIEKRQKKCGSADACVGKTKEVKDSYEVVRIEIFCHSACSACLETGTGQQTSQLGSNQFWRSACLPLGSLVYKHFHCLWSLKSRFTKEIGQMG